MFAFGREVILVATRANQLINLGPNCYNSLIAIALTLFILVEGRYATPIRPSTHPRKFPKNYCIKIL